MFILGKRAMFDRLDYGISKIFLGDLRRHGDQGECLMFEAEGARLRAFVGSGSMMCGLAIAIKWEVVAHAGWSRRSPRSALQIAGPNSQTPRHQR
jgi:hypothetical protein